MSLDGTVLHLNFAVGNAAELCADIFIKKEHPESLKRVKSIYLNLNVSNLFLINFCENALFYAL